MLDGFIIGGDFWSDDLILILYHCEKSGLINKIRSF